MHLDSCAVAEVDCLSRPGLHHLRQHGHAVQSASDVAKDTPRLPSVGGNHHDGFPARPGPRSSGNRESRPRTPLPAPRCGSCPRVGPPPARLPWRAILGPMGAQYAAGGFPGRPCGSASQTPPPGTLSRLPNCCPGTTARTGPDSASRLRLSDPFSLPTPSQEPS